VSTTTTAPLTVTILGAGAMGSALATPFRAAGHAVRLWGTHLDDHLLDAVEAGRPHPRTNVPLAPGTQTFRSAEVAAALEGADLVVLAVASVGVTGTTRLAAPHWSGARALLLTSKGFHPDDDGTVHLLPVAVEQAVAAVGGTAPPVVAVGGPCKANEVAAGTFTAAVFACADGDLAAWAAAAARTPAYRAEVLDDVHGVETVAPLKNVFAIALGIADGVGDASGMPHHNLKSAVFARAVAEMAEICALTGGDPATASGLAGAGDLEVTGLSGRNKVYGSRIGAGEHAPAALEAMVLAEQTVEGVPAAELACRLVDQRDPGAWDRLPLLRAVRRILTGIEDPVTTVAEAVLPRTVVRV
jgi:glycerol-3-phosphate dehydrogenase (NAD(P)+)